MSDRQTVLITGSTTGVGAALVDRFADAGWNVAATGLDLSVTPEYTAEQNVAALQLDVTDIASIEQAVADTIETFGGIDLVINNAGFGTFGPIETASDHQVRNIFATNTLGGIFVSRAVLPHFRERGAGMIVFVTSLTAQVSSPFHALYHSTKWATEGFAESLAYEVSAFGVTVKVCEPGTIDTGYYQRTVDNLEGQDEIYAEGIAKMQAGVAQSMVGAPKAPEVAERIFAAATDGTGRYRYFVTDMAEVVYADRQSRGDEEWFQDMLAGYRESRPTSW